MASFKIKNWQYAANKHPQFLPITNYSRLKISKKLTCILFWLVTSTPSFFPAGNNQTSSTSSEGPNVHHGCASGPGSRADGEKSGQLDWCKTYVTFIPVSTMPTAWIWWTLMTFSLNWRAKLPFFRAVFHGTYCWCSQKATVRHIPVALQKSKSSSCPNIMCTNMCAVVKLYYTWLCKYHIYMSVWKIYDSYPTHSRTICQIHEKNKLPLFMTSSSLRSIDRSTVNHQIYTESQTIIRISCLFKLTMFYIICLGLQKLHVVIL